MSEKRARRSRVLEVLQAQAEEAAQEEEGGPLDGIDEAFGLTSKE